MQIFILYVFFYFLFILLKHGSGNNIVALFAYYPLLVREGRKIKGEDLRKLRSSLRAKNKRLYIHLKKKKRAKEKTQQIIIIFWRFQKETLTSAHDHTHTRMYISIEDKEKYVEEERPWIRRARTCLIFRSSWPAWYFFFVVVCSSSLLFASELLLC